MKMYIRPPHVSGLCHVYFILGNPQFHLSPRAILYSPLSLLHRKNYLDNY